MAFDIVKNSQSLVTKAILLLLALTFVIGFGYVGGISIGGRGPSGGAAVEVNGEKVSLARFYNTRDSMLQNYREAGREISAELTDMVNFSAIDLLVSRKLLAQKASELGIRVSEQEISDTIKNNPGFQIDGVFVGAERYREFISRGLNLTVSEFENATREDILIQKLLPIIESSATASDEELFSIYRTRNEKINLNYVGFSAENYEDDVSASEEEILKYYRENTDLFWNSEKRKARYVLLSPENFVEDASASEEEIQAYYEAYPEEFTSAEGIKTLAEATMYIEQKLAEAKSSVLYEKFIERFLRKKASFSELLEEKSSLEVKMTGEFGLQDEGEDIPAAIREPAFDIEPNELGTVVLSDSIWFFEVTEVTPAKRKELESVRGLVESAVKKAEAIEKARAAAEEFLGKTKTSGKSFEKSATVFNLSVSSTGFFTRMENPLEAESEKFAAGVFKLDPSNSISEEVYKSGETFYVVSLREIESVSSEEFEAEKASFKQQNIETLKAQLLESLLDKLRESSKIVPNENLLSRDG